MFHPLRMIFFSMILVGCGAYHESYVDRANPPTPLDGPQPLGFALVQSIFANNRCFECHSQARGNRGGINLETYANTLPLAAGVLAEMESGSMPRGGPRASEDDIAVIRAWVEAGAPEEGAAL